MLRLMIVDDEAVHLMNMIGVIQILKPSFIIFSAKDGKQALNILETFQVDLLITDIKMPNMDGLTLIEQAKTIYPDLYTVILSGFGEFEFARRGIELGVDKYLLKTLDQEDLLQIMDDLEWRVKDKQELRRSEKAQQEIIKKIKLDQIEHDVEMFVLGCTHDRKSEHVQALIRNFPSGMVICARSVVILSSEAAVSDWKERVALFLRPWGESFTFRCPHANDAIVTLLGCSQIPGSTFLINLPCFAVIMAAIPTQLASALFSIACQIASTWRFTKRLRPASMRSTIRGRFCTNISKNPRCSLFCLATSGYR